MKNENFENNFQKKTYIKCQKQKPGVVALLC